MPPFLQWIAQNISCTGTPPSRPGNTLTGPFRTWYTRARRMLKGLKGILTYMYADTTFNLKWPKPPIIVALQSAKDVRAEMQKEFDRQIVEFAKLFEAFAQEDPFVFRHAK